MRGELSIDERPRVLAWRRLALWSAPAATLAGVFAHGTWRSVPLSRPVELLLIAAAAAAFAALLHRAAGLHRFTALATVWVAGLVVFGGAAPVVFMALVLCAAIGIGTLFAGTRGIGQRWFAMPAGLAVVCGTTGWLLAFPIHDANTYAFAFALIVAWRWRAIATVLVALHRGGLRAFDASPWSATFGLLLLGLASTAAWMPTLQSDDVAYHLGLPYELQALGYSRLDPDTSVWALAPWASDLLQALVQVQAGQEARGAVNAMWLALCAVGTWHVARLLDVPPALRWVGIGAIATLPLLYAQVGGMQTELPSSAVALALVVALLRRPRVGARLVLVAVLAGFLLAFKVSNGLLLVPMALWAVWRLRSGVGPIALARAIVAGVVVGGASFAFAWIIAGNPVLPMLNGLFGSPYFVQANFVDPRWADRDWRLPWSFMFETHRFVEATDGAGGMLMLVALVGGALAMRRSRARTVVLVGLAGCTLSFVAVQYLRYLLPAFVVLWPAALAGLHGLRLRREASLAVGALALLNVAFMTTGMWPILQGLLRTTVLYGHATAIERFSPHRTFAELLRTRHPHRQVMLVDGHPLPELAGRAYSNAWVDHAVARDSIAADEDPTGARWRVLLSRLDVELLASSTPLSPALRAALSTMSATRLPGTPHVDLWEIPRASLEAHVESGGGAGHWSIRIPVAPTAQHVSTRVQFDCSPVGASIATMWGYAPTDGAMRPEWWSWAACRSDGIAEVAHALRTRIRGEALAIKAEPVGAMTFSVREVSAHAGAERERRDHAAHLRRRIAESLGIARNEGEE